MKYNLELTDQARDSLKHLDRQSAIRVLRKLTWLAEHAAELNHEQLKHLSPGLEGVCKWRIGPHRAIYRLSHSERRIVVIDIIWRRAEYKELKR
jgi:mRNA-degrading endonuclease RelE of RelBE toxin-antitoxin system